jgi:hypothetical protein
MNATHAACKPLARASIHIPKPGEDSMAKKQRGIRIPRASAKPAKKSGTKKAASKKPASKKPASTVRRAAAFDPLLAPVKGAIKRDIGHVQLEVGKAGAARVKRMIYPPGFHWAVDMKPNVGTELCMHAHVGFLARGEIHIEYADGCIVEHKAPQIVAIEPGHDGWVVGKEPVILIEFDFEGDTVSRLGMPDAHRHE